MAKDYQISVKRWFGVSAGWVLKDNISSNIQFMDPKGTYVYTANIHELNNALQIGLSFAPTFGKLGLGMYTGLYYELSWAMKKIEYRDDGTKTVSQNPSMSYANPIQTLYLPAHFQYNYLINPNMSLYTSAGPSFEFNISTGFPKCAFLLGARCGFQAYGVQISLLTEWGIYTSPKLIDYGIHRPLSIQLSYMF